MNLQKEITLLPQPHTIRLERWRGTSSRPVKKTGKDPGGRPDEYRIELNEKEILLYASSGRGFQYAEQTLHSLEKKYGLAFIGMIEDYADIANRIAMLDLKRVVWKKEALLRHLHELAEWKINCCLIEYEDKFPYESLPEIRHPRAFAREDILEIAGYARDLGIELIPLVQCFSHWEYILRHSSYCSLREKTGSMQQGCPLNPAVFQLFCSMAEEVIALHQGIHSFHIGADEARLLGHCPACAEKMRREGKTALYGDYLADAIRFINGKGLHAFFWGDFYRHHDHLPQLRGLQCTAVDWAYSEKSARVKQVCFPRIQGNCAVFGTPETAVYSRFLLPDPETQTLFAFPHRKIVEADQIPVIGAGNITTPENILAHVTAAVECGSPGVIGTYWASSNSLSMPYSVYELRKSGTALLGAAAWNCAFEQQEKNTFFERFLQHAETKLQTPEELKFLHSLEHHFASQPGIPEKIPGDNPVSMKLKMEQSLAKFQHARFFDRQSYDFCDLSHLFNSTLEFNTGNHKCDFTDETLSFLPPGEHACCGIAFLLKHRILLYGRQCKAAPHRVNIRCNLRKCKAVSLIQSAVGGSADENGKWGEFRIRYADGNCYCEPLIQYDNLNAWYQPLPGRRVRIAVMESPRPSLRLGLHQFTLLNPFPEKELEEIELESTSDGVIALAAVTMISPHELNPELPDAVNTVDKIRRDMQKCGSSMERLLFSEVGDASAKELTGIALDSMKCQIDEMEQLLAFCGKNRGGR